MASRLELIFQTISVHRPLHKWGLALKVAVLFGSFLSLVSRVGLYMCMTARFARATWIRRVSSASAQVRVTRTGNNVIEGSLAIKIAPLYRGFFLSERLYKGERNAKISSSRVNNYWRRNRYLFFKRSWITGHCTNGA